MSVDNWLECEHGRIQLQCVCIAEERAQLTSRVAELLSALEYAADHLGLEVDEILMMSVDKAYGGTPVPSPSNPTESK